MQKQTSAGSQILTRGHEKKEEPGSLPLRQTLIAVTKS